jgi:hypothetical protein
MKKQKLKRIRIFTCEELKSACKQIEADKKDPSTQYKIPNSDRPYQHVISTLMSLFYC